MSQGPVIVLKKPEGLQATLGQRLLKFGEPFDRVVWLMIFLAFFTTSTVLYIISYYSPYEWRHLGMDKEATLRESESFTCMNSFWFVLSSLSWQGTFIIVVHYYWLRSNYTFIGLCLILNKVFSWVWSRRRFKTKWLRVWLQFCYQCEPFAYGVPDSIFSKYNYQFYRHFNIRSLIDK